MRSFSVLTASSLDLLILHVIELILHSIELAAAKLPDVCVGVCVRARARVCGGGCGLMAVGLVGRERLMGKIEAVVRSVWTVFALSSLHQKCVYSTGCQ